MWRGTVKQRASNGKTAVYFHAAYLPNLHIFKLCSYVFFPLLFHLKQNMSSIRPTSVFTALLVHIFTSCVIIWHSRQKQTERGLNVE